MVHGYLRLAAAHETEAAWNPTLTAKYDQIAQINVQQFLADLNETKAVRNGAVTVRFFSFLLFAKWIFFS
jgi:hypothetical protein